MVGYRLCLFFMQAVPGIREKSIMGRRWRSVSYPTGGAEGKIEGEKQQQYGGKSTGYYKQQQLIPFKRSDIALGGHFDFKEASFIGTTQSRFGLAVGRINGGFGVGRLAVLKWLAGEHIVK